MIKGASNGSLPPNEEKQLKWWGQSIFRNTGTTPSGGELSSPPSAPDYAQWDIPQFLKDDIDVANKATFGTQGESWKLEKYRICWCAFFSFPVHGPPPFFPLHVISSFVNRTSAY